MTLHPLSCFSQGVRSLTILVSLLLPLSIGAQDRPAAAAVYQRAHHLVAQGRGDAGRALVDSMVKATTPGTSAYAEALFWRASTAQRGEDAERDYIRIAIEYPLSSRAEESLIRLAEIEMMRGDRTPAQRHLQRLVIEYPNGPTRARASYWLARIFFEANETVRGCHELNIARAKASPGDVELRNQVDYEAQRCVNVELAPTASPPVATDSPPPAKDPPPASSANRQPPPSTLPASPPPNRPPPAGTSTRSTAGTTAPPSPPASTAPTAPTAGARTFTVQVAAFPELAAATTFMESLKAKGYDVRIWGTETPFRVRIGRFATRAEASALAAELRTKMISRDAWVTEAEVR